MLLAHLPDDAQSILRSALARGKEALAPYAGMVTPEEANAIRAFPGVKLIDTRTRAEWVWVGRVPGSHLVPWYHFDGESLVANSRFLTELQAVASPNDVLLFLCRSSNRSKPAATAATRAGYPLAFEILEGFEGAPNHAGHRGELNGWRYRGLPWRQD
ncbi:MAG: rhodanese-like domain-containing protein [Betaproteobacteria bacterium]|nr:rhodanese-like domain-containing protein [Betaproteobacteria bacterium]